MTSPSDFCLKTESKPPNTFILPRLSKPHTSCSSPCRNADQCSRTFFSCSHPVQHSVYCGIFEGPLLGAIMSGNIWRVNFGDCNCTDTRSCCFLDLLICTFQIELHYFNMKIATTWTLSCDSNAGPGRRNRVWQRVSLLSIYCGSGTSRSANHNTVGTMIALPSLHASVVSRLSSPPAVLCLFWLSSSFSEWKFWGRLVLPVLGERFHAQRG